jgi:ABC-2 type transport system permease protein
MRAISIIFRRELGAYLRSPIGWIIVAVALLLDGVLFQAFVMTRSNAQLLSAEVLRMYFVYASVVTAATAIILSIRLLAEERQNQSIVLLHTSPVTDTSIVLGKFLASLVFLAGILALSLYIPFLIKMEGKITTSQILVGYVGLFFYGASYLAIGLFASSLTRYQLVAAVVGAVIGGLMSIWYWVAKGLDAPFSDVVVQLDSWWGTRFERGFADGMLALDNVVYYVALTYFFLLLAVKTMEAKRWQ